MSEKNDSSVRDSTGVTKKHKKPVDINHPAASESTLCVSDLKIALRLAEAPVRERMPVLLRVANGTVVSRHLLDEPTFTIGRDPGAELPLEDALVSRRHARINWENASDPAEHPRCSVEDLESRNGTYLNDDRIPPNARIELSEGDRVQLGSTLFMFYVKEKSEADYDQRIASMATMDSLTGAANRNAFSEEAERAITRAARYGRPLCLALLDIDFFKRVNDTYGHAAGDAVLRHLAWTIIKSLRDVDVVGRIGGEEFAVLMPESSMADAITAASRLREIVEASEAPFEHQKLKVTISVGLAERSEKANTWEDLYKAADELLYEAKHTGRNRVCCKQ